MLFPLLGFFRFGFTGDSLPSWYKNSYTEEEMIKKMSMNQQRLTHYTELQLEKINELVEKVNELEGRIATLEA